MTKILLHSSWEEQSRHLSQVLATVSATELQADVFAQWVNRGESSDKRLPWQSLSNLYTLVCLHWGIWVGDAMAKNSLRWAVTRVLVWWLWKNNEPYRDTCTSMQQGYILSYICHLLGRSSSALLQLDGILRSPLAQREWLCRSPLYRRSQRQIWLSSTWIALVASVSENGSVEARLTAAVSAERFRRI